jgi:transposase-like protein
MLARPIEQFCCQIEGCRDRGMRGLGNLSFRGKGGKNKQIRMIFCRTCEKLFSERKGTALEGARLPPEKTLSILNHLREGCGVRATGRLVEVDKDTVTRRARIAGAHATRVHDERVAFSPGDQGGPVR